MLQHDEELKLCAEAHEEEVIIRDSYGLNAMLDRNIEYIVDIGANIGAFSVHAMNLFPNAKIVACEPEPKLMSYIRLNTENKLIYVQKAIVGDPKLKEVKFSICKWQGNHHVEGKFRMDTYGVPEIGSEIIGSIVVPAITLKQIVDDNQLPRIDLLKVDTEGSEPDILESIKPWLKNIRHIVGEWHSQDDLARIKVALEETHDVVYTDGFFKESTGLTANGGFTADVK